MKTSLPLLLYLELDCDMIHQRRASKHLKRVFGPSLYLPSDLEHESNGRFPSPLALQNRVILFLIQRKSTVDNFSFHYDDNEAKSPSVVNTSVGISPIPLQKDNRSYLKKYSTVADIRGDFKYGSTQQYDTKQNAEHLALEAWERKVNQSDDFGYDDMLPKASHENFEVSPSQGLSISQGSKAHNKKLTPGRTMSVIRDRDGNISTSNAIHYSMLEIVHYSSKHKIKTYKLTDYINKTEKDANNDNHNIR